LTIRASRSFSASDMSVAVFCAEVSTVRRMPSRYHNCLVNITSRHRRDIRIPDRPVFGSDVKFVPNTLERPFPITFPYHR
jgi:hypothetical protein